MNRETAKNSKKPEKTLVNINKLTSNNKNANQKTIIPPLLREVGKLAAGVATIATADDGAGSATGNPRNKHALSPGHSLMDWIRLGNSGSDLTGVGPQAGKITVTAKELSKHDKRDDAWLAIRGRVFNITHYIPFHPGGPEEIMKGAGTDATKIFDQVHPWVNYDSLLQKCYVGRLSNLDSKINPEDLFLNPSNQSEKSEKMSVTSTTTTDSRTKFNKKHDDIKFLKERMFLPRFDWIQKTDHVTVIFYTKPLCNPQVEIFPPNASNVIVIFLTYDHQVYTNEITLSDNINWPCQCKVHHETGKVEIGFKKSISKIWESYGSLKQKRDDIEKADNVRSHFVIKNREEISYNTVLIELERKDGSKLIVALGKHVRIYGIVNGDEIHRCYTPIPRSIFHDFRPQFQATDTVCLAVKRYDNGNLSKFIHDKKTSEVLDVSKGSGSFSLRKLESREMFLLLAAGTGVTPMLSLIIFLLERRIRRCQKVLLTFFNVKEKDILFKDQFESLGEIEERFKIIHVLSEENSAKWNGIKGRISTDIIRESVRCLLENTPYKQEDVYVMVCGPSAFTQLTEKLLKNMSFDNEQIHLFYN